MAYSSLVSLEQTIDLVLNHHKYTISADEIQQIASIREYAIFLIHFLENSPEKGNRLEGKIRDLANEAEDLIEDFMWSQFRLGWSVGLPRDEFEGRLERAGVKIGEIVGDLMDRPLFRLPAAISSHRAAATGKNGEVVRLDEDLLAIKGRLCGESPRLEVIPVVGMAGIGKTTLARYAFDDSLIMEHFDIRAFVQVSQDFSANEFLLKLLDSINLFEKQKSGDSYKSGVGESETAEKDVASETKIAESVYKGLKGRRYVIVMDDIWSTDDWDNVSYLFPDDNNGSRIMLTTRLSQVAAYASSGDPLHEVKFMDEDQSWDLLKQKMSTRCPTELEGIGKEIARACRGLPLAVVLVAGILSTIDKTRASWEKIAKNVNSVVEGQLEEILSLSYTVLPHHLRPCFLFMAGFPEDYSINVRRLIKLWVAEGFLKSRNGCKSLEEEAGEYLEDLVKRSLVLVTSRKSDGKIKTCSLHDLVRDMCIRKAREEKFLLTGNDIVSTGGIDMRHVSIAHCHLDEIWSPTLRTILCFEPLQGKSCSEIFKPEEFRLEDSSSLVFVVRFRLLRVLEVVHQHYAFLPPQVFELFHLRYLALAFFEVPAAISKLVNLQTLIIVSRSKAKVVLTSFFLVDLPLEIWGMQRLRHLVLRGCDRLLNPADGSSLCLENLQTLSVIPSSICTPRILKMIPNLKKLGIICCRNEEHHGPLNLVHLHKLEKLKVYQMFNWQGWQSPAFPRTLTRLTLVGWGLRWEDMSVVGSLPNLQVLKLKDDACDGDTWETNDGEFPGLKLLLIENSDLHCWITESDHFPRLVHLVLRRCEYLREIPDSIGDIPTIELIEVDKGNKSLMKSAKQIQEDQQSYGNDTLQVRVV